MFRYRVSWYDVETGLTISKTVELDDSMLEDIATTDIPQSYMRDIINSLDPMIDFEECC